MNEKKPEKYRLDPPRLVRYVERDADFHQLFNGEAVDCVPNPKYGGDRIAEIQFANVFWDLRQYMAGNIMGNAVMFEVAADWEGRRDAERIIAALTEYGGSFLDHIVDVVASRVLETATAPAPRRRRERPAEAGEETP